MKIAFLHISDLHIKDKLSVTPLRVQALISTLNGVGHFDGIVIVISGDIAARGGQNEYKIASDFLGSLISGIKSSFSLNEKDIKLLIVPGNHDICYPTGQRPTSEAVRKAFDSDKDEYLKEETSNMVHFLSFADSNKCFFKETTIPNGELYTRKILHFSTGYRIEANLINTAPFSCAHDDGLHYIPDGVVNNLSNPSSANISIIVMHHSPDWFNFSQRKNLQKVISQRCSIAFFGHEHMAGSQQVIPEGVEGTVYQGGGAWWQEDTPDKCEYYVSILDSISNEYEVLKFLWNGTGFYSLPTGSYAITHKPLNGVSLLCSKEYLTHISEDPKHAVTNDIADYYVFLKLRINDPKKILEEKSIGSLDSLISYISDKHYVAVIGGTNSGKTTLLRILFRALYENHTVLYCGTDDITGRNSEKIIKELVETTYGEQSYSAFKAIPSCNKIMLIDDLHRIAPRHINKFLNEIKQQFGTIVFATDNMDRFDIIQELRNSIQTEEEFHKLYLTRLYAAKRYELISKIVKKKNNSDVTSCDTLARTLEQCLNTYRLSFNTDIDFVVQFTDYYCSHFSELDGSDKAVFSKVFEASIERAISEKLINRKENAGDIIVALSEVAYYVHFHMEYPVSRESIIKTIKHYDEYYDNKYLLPDRFIEIAVGSGLLITSPAGDAYRFKSKDHLAYFVAKALNRKYHDDNDDSFLRQIVTQSCFGINGDILLFLTYIGDNVAIVRLLLAQECELVKDWPEFNISKISAKYLETTCTAELDAPTSDKRNKNLENRSAAEEIISEEEAIQTIDIYDYDISRVDELGNQIIRAFLGLRTLARGFSSFFSILPAHDKKKVASELYKLPNKIFGRLSEEVDLHAKELVDDLFSQQSTENGEPQSKGELLQTLQMMSIQSLLSLYSTVTQHGVNQSTIDYLASQDFLDGSATYQTERIFFYDKVDDWANVIQNVEELYKKNDSGVLRTLCLICLHHTLVYSKGISNSERRRVVSTYFPKATTKLLISRQKVFSEKKV